MTVNVDTTFTSTVYFVTIDAAVAHVCRSAKKVSLCCVCHRPTYLRLFTCQRHNKNPAPWRWSQWHCMVWKNVKAAAILMISECDRNKVSKASLLYKKMASAAEVRLRLDAATCVQKRKSTRKLFHLEIVFTNFYTSAVLIMIQTRLSNSYT